MPRAATTLDPFNAIAESKRREVLGVLANGEMPVNGLVQNLGWPQPQVSKHLKVLLAVGLVDVRRTGKQRLYRINGEPLKAVYDWVATFDEFWKHQLQRIKERAESKSAGKS